MTQKVGRARQAGSGATIGQSVRHRAVKRFDWADTLAWHIKLQRLPEPVREYRPFAHRRFRLDCAWPDRKLFVECDGGEFLKASARRHGGAKDCERWNLLTLDGWTGFRFVGSQVRSGEALRVVEDALWLFPVKSSESPVDDHPSFKAVDNAKSCVSADLMVSTTSAALPPAEEPQP